MYKVKDQLEVTMNYSNPGDNIIEIERNNRTVKEIYCAQYHRLTFQNISKILNKYLDFELVRKLIYFPVKRNFITIL